MIGNLRVRFNKKIQRLFGQPLITSVAKAGQLHWTVQAAQAFPSWIPQLAGHISEQNHLKIGLYPKLGRCKKNHTCIENKPAAPLNRERKERKKEFREGGQNFGNIQPKKVSKQQVHSTPSSNNRARDGHLLLL